MHNRQESEKSRITGYLSAMSAIIMWGILPFYWKSLHNVPAVQIMLNRIVWSFVFLLIVSFFRKTDSFSCFKSGKLFSAVLVTGLILSANWFTYIYAVNSERIVEASLGYYINPLVSIILGMIFFRERLNKLQVTALILAVSGVIYMTLDYGRFPYIALILAVTFGFYGLLKKYFSFDSVDGLIGETLAVTPAAVIILIIIALKGESALFSGSPSTDILIMLSGVATGFPLILYGEGANRIPLSALGFLMYIAPTLMLLTGIFYYKEPFLRAHMIGFCFIWTGLIFYSYSIIKELKNDR